MLHTTEWRNPFTDAIFWTSEYTSDTALSMVIKRDGLVPIQNHRWLFGQGGSKGSCALGSGAALIEPVQNANAASFIDCAAKCGEKAFAQAWLKLLLNPTTSNTARIAIPELSNIKPISQLQFDQWWATQINLSSQVLGSPPPQLTKSRTATFPATALSR